MAIRSRVLSFESEQSRRRAFAGCDRGLQVVEVARIVGSVGRARELDGRFRYRRGRSQASRESIARLRHLREMFAAGRVPPLELYQIGDDYFVLDGHHRAAIAMERGQDFVDANVVEYRPDPLDPTNAVYYERLAFVAATGLRDVLATESERYPKLLARIQSFRHELNRRPAPSTGLIQPRIPAASVVTSGPVDLRHAARLWLESEYAPVIAVLGAERIQESFPGRAPGDLYGYVSDHRWYLSERRGWDVGVDDALADFVHRFGPADPNEAVIDPIVALGSDVLEKLFPACFEPLRSATASAALALVVGLAALPVAFVRGLRPRHYRMRHPTFAC